MRRGRRAGLSVLLIGVVTMAVSARAHADSIDVQSRQLEASSDYKLRVSAALNLARSSDPRAVRALVDALDSDSAGTVRRVAAVALGRARGVPAATMRRVIAGLRRAARIDRDSQVRRNARRSLKRLEGATGPGRGRRLYLAVGTPADPTRSAPRDAARTMRATVQRTLRAHAPGFEQGAGALPTRAELSAMGADGFYIGSSVADLRVRRQGRSAEVRCSVSVRISPWDGRDGHEKLVAGRSASASGSGRVVASPGRRALQAAKRECLSAVVEQVTARQVVPFLKGSAD